MSGHLLLRAMVVLGALCGVQTALADCGSSIEKDLRFKNGGIVIKFRPSPSGEVDAVGASLSRANEDVPYVRISVEPILGELHNNPFNSNGGAIYYLEESAQGQRLCRVEEWKRRESKLIGQVPPESLHSAVKPVYPYFELSRSYELHYDSAGRLTSIQNVDAKGRRVTTFCALYDENGRIEVANESSGLIVSDRPEFQCSQLRDMPSRTTTRYFTYRPDGSLASDVEKEATRKPGEDPDREDAGPGTEATDGAWTVGGLRQCRRC